MADQRTHTFQTGIDGWTTVVHNYGNGRGTREQFAKSNPEDLTPVIDILKQSSEFADGTVHADLGNIMTKLGQAWKGKNADDAVTTLQTLQGDSKSISQSTLTLSTSLGHFRTAWGQIRAGAMTLDDDDDAGARHYFDQFVQAENDCKKPWPSTLYYHTPVGNEQGYDPNPNPGPAPAPGGGPGYPSGHPGYPSGGPSYPSGHPGYPSGHPSYPSGTPGYPSGTPGYPSGSPGGSYTGGGGYPGATTDTGSTLAGFGEGAGGSGPSGFGPGGGGLASGGLGGGVGDLSGSGLGGGVGGGAGGLGSGGGAGTGGGVGGALGSGGAGGGGGGFGGGGVVAGGGAGPGRGMMAPMHGGGGNDEDERERSTWLSEDDDVWGGDDLPPGVIG